MVVLNTFPAMSQTVSSVCFFTIFAACRIASASETKVADQSEFSSRNVYFIRSESQKSWRFEFGEINAV